MPPTSATPPPPPPGPLVTVRYPDADHIHLILRPGADIATLAATYAALPDDAFYLDADGEPDRLRLLYRRPPPPTSTRLTIPPPGWTPTTSNGHRPAPSDADQAVAVVAAGLLLGTYDRDILCPADRSRPTVLTLVGLIRARANHLARPPRHP